MITSETEYSKRTKRYIQRWIPRATDSELRRLKERYRKAKRKKKGTYTWKEFWEDLVWSIRNV